jgi:mannosyltransferase OCH1-like enzyme
MVLLILLAIIVFTVFIPMNLYFDLNYDTLHRPIKHHCIYPPKTRRIPRIIHQTWKTPDLLPFQSAYRLEFMNALSSVCPAYDFKLHTDRDFLPFVERYFSWFLPTWHKLTPFIKKVDTIRYMWLYIYGGIYIDLDVRLKNVTFFHDIFTSTEYPVNTLIVHSNSSFTPFMLTGPALIAAHAGHDFFINMLYYISDHHHEGTIRATGPTAMTNCLKLYLKNLKRKGYVKLISCSKAGMGFPNKLVRSMTSHVNSGLWTNNEKDVKKVKRLNMNVM